MLGSNLIKNSTLLTLVVLIFSINSGLANERVEPLPVFEIPEIGEAYNYDSLYITQIDSKLDPVDSRNQVISEIQTGSHQESGSSIFDKTPDQTVANLDAGIESGPYSSDEWYVDFSGGQIHNPVAVAEGSNPLSDSGEDDAIEPMFGYQSEFFAAEVDQQGFAAAKFKETINF